MHPADSQHFEDSKPIRNHDLLFIFPHTLIYLSTVLESVDQMWLGSVEILSFTNFYSGRSWGQPWITF